MFVWMTAILIAGVCVLILICVTQSHAATCKLASLRTELDSDIQSVRSADAKLEERLIQQLIDGEDVGQAVDKYHATRRSLLPGAGQRWDEKTLSRQKEKEASGRAAAIRQKAVYTTAISLVLAVLVFAGATLAVYATFCGPKSPTELPAPLDTSQVPAQLPSP